MRIPLPEPSCSPRKRQLCSQPPATINHTILAVASRKCHTLQGVSRVQRSSLRAPARPDDAKAEHIGRGIVRDRAPGHPIRADLEVVIGG